MEKLDEYVKEIESASRGSEIREPMVGALNALNDLAQSIIPITTARVAEITGESGDLFLADDLTRAY